MVAYSFKQQFVEPIRSGSKRQTIRADRKRHARPGESISLYTGMRTKHCKLIGVAECIAVEPIRMILGPLGSVEISGIEWSGTLDQFAQTDGFQKWDDLLYFWELNHAELSDFSGQLIRWDKFDPWKS